MPKISKKKMSIVLKEKFPELHKLSEELSLALDCVLQDVQEKLDKIYEVEDMLQELMDSKVEINEKLDQI